MEAKGLTSSGGNCAHSSIMGEARLESSAGCLEWEAGCPPQRLNLHCCLVFRTIVWILPDLMPAQTKKGRSAMVKSGVEQPKRCKEVQSVDLQRPAKLKEPAISGPTD